MSIVNSLLSALKKPLVFRSVAAFIVMTSLLGLVLILTEQLRWLPSPWPMPVRRVLFDMLFVLSSVCFVVFGAGSAFQIRSLCRSGASWKQQDGMKTLRHIIIIPVTYLLSACWAWAWLGGHSPRHYGAAIVEFFVASYITAFAYYAVRSFRQAESARARGVDGGNMSTAVTTPRHAANGCRAALRRLRRSLQRFVWEVGWKAFGTRRLLPLDRALCQAVLTGNANNVEVFLHRGGNANVRLLYNSPLLVISAGDGPAEIVRLLLEAGADINAVSPTTGTTALARAAMQGHQAAVRLLLEHGAAVEVTSNSGATPLIFAASEGYTDCVRLLLASRANANAATKRGMTSLMFAARQGSVEMAQVLLGAGADADARTKSGRTILSWADKSSHEAMALLLQQRQNAALKVKD